MRLPGFGEDGPTLEIFSYRAEDDGLVNQAAGPHYPPTKSDDLGFSHIAFAVDDVVAIAKKVIEHGGCAVGEFTERKVEAVGWLTIQYMADPEGNLVEIQNWRCL